MNEVVLNFKIKSTGAEEAKRGLDGVNKSGSKAEHGFKRLQAETAKTESTFFKLTPIAGALSAALGGIGFARLAGNVISATKEMQTLKASLVTVKGSAVEAEKAFSKIQDFATKTPFQLAEVTNAFIKMEALGLQASEKSMRAYGDTASAMGKSLNQMIEAVADAATGEFERLKEFGIKSSREGDNVSFRFKGMTTTVRNSSAEIEKYLVKLGETNFSGGMARQMDTVDGKLSNLEDSLDKAFNAIGTESQPAISAAIDGLSGLAGSVEEASKYIDDAAYLASIGLTTALTAKAVPAVWATATAFNAATLSAGGFAVAARGATAAAIAFAATPFGLAVTAMAAGAAYLTLRTDETAEATAELTAELKKQNIELSQSEIKIRSEELVEYRQRLKALLAMKQSGAVDIFDVKENKLLKEIGRLEKGKTALVTVTEMLNAQNREFNEITDEQSGMFSGLDVEAKKYLETLSWIAQSENEMKNEAISERTKIQEKINELTFTEAQTRQAILDKTDPENKALQQKLFLVEDTAKQIEAATKKKKELKDVNAAYVEDIERLSFELVKYKLSAIDVAAAEAMRAAANKGYSRDQINEIGKQTKALYQLEDANKLVIDSEEERNIIYENLFNRLDDGFAGMWVDVMDGSKNAFDFIQESFKRTLAEMAHAAITKPIIISAMGGEIGGAGSLASLASLASQGLGYASSLTAGASSGQAAMLAAQTAEFGTAGASMTAGAFGTTSGSLAAGATTAAPWLLGGLAVDQLTGGAISKGLFGGDYKRKNAEISLSGGLDYVDATQSVTSKKSGGLFSSSKSKTTSSDISDSLGVTVNSLLRDIDTIANQIGYDLADSFATEVSVSAGKKGDIKTAMNEAVGMAADQAIASIDGLKPKLEDMRFQGESLIDTFKRLVIETEAEKQAAQKAADEKSKIAEQELKATEALNAARKAITTELEKTLVQQFMAFEDQAMTIKTAFLSLISSEQALAFERENELKNIDPLLQSQQKRLWALQDEAAAIDKAKQAHNTYQNTLSSVLGSLGSAFTNIKQFTAALVLGASATGASYAGALSLAQTGDQTALGSITQSAQAYLDDALAKSSTRLEYDRFKSGIVADLNKLPEQVSAQQYIANEIKQAIAEQTDALGLDYAASLKTNFDALIPVVGQTITKDEFSSVYSGTATDAELQKVFLAIAGSDGLIDATDLTTAAAADTALKTEDVSVKAKSQLSELETITANTAGTISAMGVLTEALGYNSKVQQQSVLQSAVDTAQSRFDNLSISGEQVVDWETKKAAAESTDAEVLRRNVNLKRDEMMAAYKSYGADSSYYKSAVAGFKSYSNQWSDALIADANFSTLSDLSSDVQRYYEVAAQLAKAKEALNAMPAFATGTNYVNRDMIAQVHKGEMIVPAKFNPSTSGINNSQISGVALQLGMIKTELVALRKTNEFLMGKIEKNTYNSNDTLDSWDVIGMPEVRS